ncbi:hypothetical protein CYLTODRAFT_453241 [Cylindrobasidium torrendii FP15055 ss-10]|uniref:SnoaL-like domain-containing protein n=1 Tax=Cylindrobasidium torrendii FP15055 ss-10 TaxID=1314674 RepID=A0A0D7BGK8_9AGAR|nr:hypothetical protein CYLTODRAFT_453241 [Cylindrobasidium torrendii FP15055 ss-10]
MPSTTSPEARTLQSAFNAINACDGTGFLEHLTPDAETVILPTSLGMVNFPPERVAQHITEQKHFSKPFVMKLTRIIETNESVPTIVAQAVSDGKSQAGTVWHNEYMFIIEFAPRKGDELPKIKKWTEFLDALRITKYMEEEAKKGTDDVAKILSAYSEA